MRRGSAARGGSPPRHPWAGSRATRGGRSATPHRRRHRSKLQDLQWRTDRSDPVIDWATRGVVWSAIFFQGRTPHITPSPCVGEIIKAAGNGHRLGLKMNCEGGGCYKKVDWKLLRRFLASVTLQTPTLNTRDRDQIWAKIPKPGPNKCEEQDK